MKNNISVFDDLSKTSLNTFLIDSNSELIYSYFKQLMECKIPNSKIHSIECKTIGANISKVINEIKNSLTSTFLFEEQKIIYFLRNFDLLRASNFNKFLKLFEETDNNVYFIALYENESNILKTIFSRSVRISVNSNSIKSFINKDELIFLESLELSTKELLQVKDNDDLMKFLSNNLSKISENKESLIFFLKEAIYKLKDKNSLMLVIKIFNSKLVNFKITKDDNKFITELKKFYSDISSNEFWNYPNRKKIYFWNIYLKNYA